MMTATAKPLHVWHDLSAADLVHAYEVALATRAQIVTCMMMKTRGEGVEFWIGGPGEEVHGTATALALHRVVRGVGEPKGEVGLFLHYRSDALAAMTTALHGDKNFVLDYFRQALSRITDPHSGGRQMVMHLCRPEHGIWPVQSPVGMQLGKAAGYARGLQLLGKKGLAVGIVGDGTTGESDFHECAMAASLWKLPLIMMVTNNDVAISVTPKDGRGIRDYRKYAEAFGLMYFECDGFDFMDTYRVTSEAAQAVMEAQARGEGRSALLVAKVPRLMGHSSSSGGQFEYDVTDPLLDFGAWLASEKILSVGDVFRRGEIDRRKSYFEVHQLGSMMEKVLDDIRETWTRVRQEPSPSVEANDHLRHAHPPFPIVKEPPTDPKTTTQIQVNEALNLALDRILADGKAAIWGQDVGHRGGIFKVTNKLIEKYPRQVRDAPINEPMIVGTAMGAAFHKELALLPEVQFGDYTLNCLHWFVHLGNVYWMTNGQTAVNVTVRFPVDPVLGGAAYHSMSVDGFYGSIPGLVLTIPSCAYDAYGLLRTAAEYTGPVLQMEPKRLYRMKLGPVLPGEPADTRIINEARKNGDSPPFADYRIPFGKAAKRRSGDDLTIVSWGWAAWQSVAAANAIAKRRGIQTEVWDLRTLVPYDREAILQSARRTGKVLIAQNDRVFGGFGRQIQGDLVESLSGVAVRVVGQQYTPAVGQARALEDAITLQVEDIADAIDQMADLEPAAWLENELHWLSKAPSRGLM
ncbi:MAG: thiamine pyrophosphate-dependent enzyme [Myxococcota bacterium]